MTFRIRTKKSVKFNMSHLKHDHIYNRHDIQLHNLDIQMHSDGVRIINPETGKPIMIQNPTAQKLIATMIKAKNENWTTEYIPEDIVESIVKKVQHDETRRSIRASSKSFNYIKTVGPSFARNNGDSIIRYIKENSNTLLTRYLWLRDDEGTLVKVTLDHYNVTIDIGKKNIARFEYDTRDSTFRLSEKIPVKKYADKLQYVLSNLKEIKEEKKDYLSGKFVSSETIHGALWSHSLK